MNNKEILTICFKIKILVFGGWERRARGWTGILSAHYYEKNSALYF